MGALYDFIGVLRVKSSQGSEFGLIGWVCRHLRRWSCQPSADVIASVGAVWFVLENIDFLTPRPLTKKLCMAREGLDFLTNFLGFSDDS